jgi:hypothetical protein
MLTWQQQGKAQRVRACRRGRRSMKGTRSGREMVRVTRAARKRRSWMRSS